ncbi:hypothetical protein HOY82DRAFT_81552 [Tuber indicum]|nr:hypothetical protein HOY82DRAFT_81552 [Tuber indicum]
MQFKSFSYLFLLTALPSALAQSFGTCTATNQLAGECIKTSTCSDQGGVSDPANLCPGDDTIQCCTYGTCKNGAGVAGTCQPTSTCKGTPDPGNHCPGPQNIQCCTGNGPSPPSDGGNLPGLDATQSHHARTIIAVAREYGVGNRGCQVSIVTAMQESRIRVLANPSVPDSNKYPHDGTGSDHDSVGIFQQRPQFWGTVKDCMDPKSSAGKFFTALKKVNGWERMEIGRAAQSVQRSAFPDAYTKHTPLAKGVCEAGGI